MAAPDSGRSLLARRFPDLAFWAVLCRVGAGAWPAFALLLHQPLRGRTLVRTVSLLPWALPTTVMALGWRWIFNDPFGPINLLLARVGLPTVSF